MKGTDYFETYTQTDDNIKSYAMAVVYPVLFQDPYKSENLLTTQATNFVKMDCNSGSYISTAGVK